LVGSPPATEPEPLKVAAGSGASSSSGPSPAPEPLPPSSDLPPPLEPAPGSAPSGPVAEHDALLPPPADGAGPESAPAPAPTPARAKPRWRDLAANRANPPPLESRKTLQSSSGESDTYCHFDASHRRMEDFRLPDLQGRLVRFQEFDSDLILLDFWGSWC